MKLNENPKGKINKKDVIHVVAMLVFTIVAISYIRLAFWEQAGQVQLPYLLFSLPWFGLVVRELLRWSKEYRAENQNQPK